MKKAITIGTKKYWAETAAISCIRYRSEYGVSPMNVFCQPMPEPELAARLVELVWIMCSPEDEDLAEFAVACRLDIDFNMKAILLRRELLKCDGGYSPPANTESVSPEEFDEFNVLALMSATGVAYELIYELPIMQINALMQRVYEFKSGGKSGAGGTTKHTWVKATPEQATRMFS